MPLVELTTSVELKGEALRAFNLDLSKLTAELMGAKIDQVAVLYTYDANLILGGSFDPAFIMRVGSRHNISAEQNIGHSKAYFDFFKEKLDIPAPRGRIGFSVPDPDNIGVFGTTLTQLLSTKQ